MLWPIGRAAWQVGEQQSPATALPAIAADYEPPIVIDQPVEEVPVEIGSGWYLRGDIGYNFQVDADGDFDYRTFDALTGVYSDSPLRSANGSFNRRAPGTTTAPSGMRRGCSPCRR